MVSDRLTCRLAGRVDGMLAALRSGTQVSNGNRDVDWERCRAAYGLVRVALVVVGGTMVLVVANIEGLVECRRVLVVDRLVARSMVFLEWVVVLVDDHRSRHCMGPLLPLVCMK